MRKAVRVYSDQEEVEILARYIGFRRRMNLPRIYNHPRRARYYRVAQRWYTLGQLEALMAGLERGGKAAA